jgi:heme/copper-type cytochrome/quinol oxidase subunit 2
MKNPILKTASLLSTVLLLTFASCKKDDKTPAPVEQELITTVKLSVVPIASNALPFVFTYKVENGFNNTTPGTIQIDTVRFLAGITYSVYVDVYNEKANPVDTTTNEIVAERNAHLFFYVSTPATGAGSVALVAGSGSKDFNGNPFNRELQMTAGSAGAGKLRVLLIHEPTNKAAETPDAAGGETDVDVTFPVIIR